MSRDSVSAPAAVGGEGESKTAVFIDVDDTLIDGEGDYNKDLIDAIKKAQDGAIANGKQLDIFLFTAAAQQQASSSRYATALSSGKTTRAKVLARLNSEGINARLLVLGSAYNDNPVEAGEALIANEKRVMGLVAGFKGGDSAKVPVVDARHLLCNFSESEIQELIQLIQEDVKIFEKDRRNSLIRSLGNVKASEKFKIQLSLTDESRIYRILYMKKRNDLVEKLNLRSIQATNQLLDGAQEADITAMLESVFPDIFMAVLFNDVSQLNAEPFDFPKSGVMLGSPVLIDELWELYFENNAEVKKIFPEFNDLIKMFQEFYKSAIEDPSHVVHKKIQQSIEFYKKLSFEDDVSEQEKANTFVSGKGPMLNAVLNAQMFADYDRCIFFDDKQAVIDVLEAVSQTPDLTFNKTIVISHIKYDHAKKWKNNPKLKYENAFKPDACGRVSTQFGVEESDGLTQQRAKPGCWGDFWTLFATTPGDGKAASMSGQNFAARPR